MKNKTIVITCCAMIIASGIAHGILTDRWVDSADIDKAVQNFQAFPLEFGDWKGVIVNQNAGKDSRLAASAEVCYHNSLTGKKVTVFLGCGRPGPVSIHTPDVCYAASGFDVEPQSTETFATSDEMKSGKVLTARFKKTKSGEQTLLRIYWTWFANNEWTVSSNPRLQYYGQKILYKLYILHKLENLSDPPSQDVCVDLLPKLSRELEKSVIITNHK